MRTVCWAWVLRRREENRDGPIGMKRGGRGAKNQGHEPDRGPEHLVAGAGFEPKVTVSSEVTEITQDCAESMQDKALPDSPDPAHQQMPARCEHSDDSSPHPVCAICVQQNQPAMPEDLSRVVVAWDRLPAGVKADILAMVAGSTGE